MRAPDGSPFQDFFDEFSRTVVREGPRNRKVSGSAPVSSSMPRKAIIVTNNHVIEGAERIEVNFADELQAQGGNWSDADSKTDLCRAEGRAASGP